MVRLFFLYLLHLLLNKMLVFPDFITGSNPNLLKIFFCNSCRRLNRTLKKMYDKNFFKRAV
jgi:hypothetical protein